MKINIYGSTGIIGKTTLSILKKLFPKYKIDLLCAKNNYRLLVKQCNEFNVKYVYLDNQKKNSILKNLLPKNVKILNQQGLIEYINTNKSDLSVLSVSGYQSLKYLELIMKNSKKIGIVSKEAIVSSGHILNKISRKYNCKIFPLDSEHFSIYKNFNKLNLQKNNFEKIYLTASGGPFINKKFKFLKHISFKEATNHPKWNMGYKNSIDSATLVNKCLELIEAHYLFCIPMRKLDILIHPESLIHSIIEDKNYISKMIYFYNDMRIPIIHFLNDENSDRFPKVKKYSFKNNNKLTFRNVNDEIFPVYEYFKKLDISKPCNIIKFNIGNEYAVDLFKQNKIKYIEILQFIKEITSLNINSDVNNTEKILKYHENLNHYIKSNFY